MMTMMMMAKAGKIDRRAARFARRMCAALVVAAAALTLPAAAQNVAAIKAKLNDLRPKDYPTRPIELVVAFPTGGGMDVHARLFAKYLEKYTGQHFIVVSRAGASGFIGHTYITTQARPDGYTVGVLSSNFWADSIQRGEGKWTYRDVEPIAFFNSEPLGWIVTTSGPLKDKKLQDVIALAKSKPGTLRVAMSEASPTRYLAEQVENAGGVRFNQIPYQGGRQAQTDLMGGQIEVSYGYMGEYRGMLEAGRVQPLAVTSAARTSMLPDVPTFNEVLGANDVLWDAFRFIVVPKGVPADRRAWLEAACNALLDDPELAKEVAALGALLDRNLDTPRKLADEIERRVARERVYYEKKDRPK